jgi:hypothetical protein
MDISFAIIEHTQDYYEFYDVLLPYIKSHFVCVESGIQGDAWIWIEEKGQKVAIDTFHAMQFEIKSDSKHALLMAVIDIVQKRYPVRIYDSPIER